MKNFPCRVEEVQHGVFAMGEDEVIATGIFTNIMCTETLVGGNCEFGYLIPFGTVFSSQK